MNTLYFLLTIAFILEIASVSSVGFAALFVVTATLIFFSLLTGLLEIYNYE